MATAAQLPASGHHSNSGKSSKPRARSVRLGAHPHGGGRDARRQPGQAPPAARRRRSARPAANVVVDEIVELIVVVGLGASASRDQHMIWYACKTWRLIIEDRRRDCRRCMQKCGVECAVRNFGR